MRYTSDLLFYNEKDPAMKLSDATRLSALVRAYQKRLRQVESVQRRAVRLLDAIDDAELTEDVMTFLETAFDDASDVIAGVLAASRKVGSDEGVGEGKTSDATGDDGNGRRRDRQAR